MVKYTVILVIKKKGAKQIRYMNLNFSVKAFDFHDRLIFFVVILFNSHCLPSLVVHVLFYLFSWNIDVMEYYRGKF